MTIPDINGENLEAQSQKECRRFEIGPIKKGVKTSPILFRFFKNPIKNRPKAAHNKL